MKRRHVGAPRFVALLSLRQARASARASGSGALPPMRISHSHRWQPLLFAVLLLGCALVRARSSWASFEFAKPKWDSSTKFLQLAREQLGTRRVILTAELDWSQVTPRDAVLVMHPQSRLQFAQVSAFLSAGGRMALIDDFGKADQLLTRFHIHRKSAPSRPLETLQNNPHLQVARAAQTLSKSGAELRHPMVDDVDRVVTNHPSALHTAADVELTPVLTLADTSGEQHLFAVIGVIGDAVACGLDDGEPKTERARCGRLFAMGDPSVFIDLMMQFEGNQKLAHGLLSYLLEDDAWGERQGNLYVLANDFTQAGNFGGGSEFERQLDSALDTISGWLNDTQSDGLPARAAWLLALVACAAVAIGVWRTSGKVYERPVPRYAKGQVLAAQGGLGGRAAMLSARATDRSLRVLELKSATEEWLRQRLGLPEQSAQQAILEAVEQQAVLDRRSLSELKDLFRQMADAERAMLTSESARFSAESIKQMHQTLQRIFDHLGTHGRST